MAEWGKDKDYDEYMKMINRSFEFRTKHDQFLNRLPKLYLPTQEPVSKNVVAYRGGKIAAAVGSYEIFLTVGGVKLKVNGIGNVAVSPDHRREGLMRECLDYAVSEMIARGDDLSFLGGQRQRYEYFGYERCGCVLSFRFIDDNIRHSFGSRESALKLFKINPGNKTYLDKAFDLYNSGAGTVFTRDRATLYYALKSWFNQPYAVLKGGRMVGYVLFNESRSNIGELFLDDANDMEDLLICICKFRRGNSFTIDMPDFRRSYCDKLAKYCENSNFNNTDSFSIYNYKNVITALLRFKAETVPLSAGSVVILFKGKRCDEDLRITIDESGKVSVEDTTDKPDITLSHTDAVRFLGTEYQEDRIKLPAQCYSWFPLPFHVYPSDGV